MANRTTGVGILYRTTGEQGLISSCDQVDAALHKLVMNVTRTYTNYDCFLDYTKVANDKFKTLACV